MAIVRIVLGRFLHLCRAKPSKACRRRQSPAKLSHHVEPVLLLPLKDPHDTFQLRRIRDACSDYSMPTCQHNLYSISAAIGHYEDGEFSAASKRPWYDGRLIGVRWRYRPW